MKRLQLTQQSRGLNLLIVTLLTAIIVVGSIIFSITIAPNVGSVGYLTAGEAIKTPSQRYEKTLADYLGNQPYQHLTMQWLSHLVMRRDLYYPHITIANLKIDGQPYLAFRSYRDVKQVIDGLTSYRKKEATLVDVSVNQRLSFENKIINMSEFSGFHSLESALAYIENGGIKVITYTIEKGDTLSEIAAAYNTTVERLLGDNPALGEKKYLTIGDVIVINRPEPLVTQFATVLETHEEKLAPSQDYIDDNAMYQGEKKLVSKGEFGVVKVTEKVVYRNGVWYKSERESEEVVVSAVNDVYYRGTKPLPKQLANSTLMRPASAYRVTSRFGPRSLGYHYGIDLKMSVGSSVYAAESGVVTRAGYSGGYGYLVVINHGGGLETYYGHNSKLLVNVGQRVVKGQKISLSGNTGRSTGPHLHFEIKIDGVSVNPEKYLPF